MPYPILTVAESDKEDIEQLGSKRKFWFRRGEERWLFKFARANTGEHWAEKIAGEVARLLEVSAASIELAEFNGERGVASRSFVDPSKGEVLIHGNEVLAGQVLGYDKTKRFRQSDHTVENILTAIGKVFTDSERVTQLRTLAGFLVLDAVVANTDRHHENWGLLQRPKEGGDTRELLVAPSFDHASSLGRELTDARRAMYLNEGRVGWYVERGRGGVFLASDQEEGVNPLRLTKLVARKYGTYFEPSLGRVGVLDQAAIDHIFQEMPEGWMSDQATNFARGIILYSLAELRT